MLWLALMLVWGGSVFLGDEATPCADCHGRQQSEFQQSRMAVAARTATFRKEWQQKGEPESCFDCHSPSRSEGVACADCHGTGGHPYPRLQVPGTCARCHDAPGEITVRSFRHSSAARRGEDCLSCHLPDQEFSHDFRGPARPGFLHGVASLLIAFRQEPSVDTALLVIRHRAGHVLPGGTTGRAVWLVVEQCDEGGQVVDERRYRFGWLHSAASGWRENTLPPGSGKVIEVPLHEAARRIRAKLIYRFRAGALDLSDPDQVVLIDKTRRLAFRMAR